MPLQLWLLGGGAIEAESGATEAGVGGTKGARTLFQTGTSPFSPSEERGAGGADKGARLQEIGSM